MIFHNIIFAYRSFKRHWTINALNTFGLSLGLAAFLILAFYIQKESNFDDFHKDADVIYRVESSFIPIETKNDKMATASFGYGPAMQKDIPEVQEYCRINLFEHEKDVKYKDRIYRESFVVPVDSNFFTFFSFPLIEGDPKTVLNAPETMVISESAAKKYFKDENPMGKVMAIKTINNSQDYTITGVFEDFPENAHFKSDFLLSYPYASRWLNLTWYMHEAYLYLKIKDESQLITIQNKFVELSEQYKNNAALKTKQWQIDLIPLKDIHLNEPKAYELENKGSRKSLAYLRLIAILVIVIAWLNYINISTTYALERRAEIGVRRVNGAGIKEIVRQFLAEAFFANILALLLSFLMIYVFLPLVQNSIIESDLSGIWLSSTLWVYVAFVLVLGIILTGIVPAFMLLKMDTHSILIHKTALKGGHKPLREILVVAQFVIAIILIVGSIVVRKQIWYMSRQDLGVDITQTLVFKAPTQTVDYGQKLKTLKEEIMRTAGAEGICISSAIPGKAVAHCLSNSRVDLFPDRSKLCEMLRVDFNFLDFYGLKILNGRSFQESNVNDKDALVLTESAAQLFGFDNYAEAINKELRLEGHQKKFKIIGIIKDYHHLSLKDAYRPIILFMADEHPWIRNQFISVKLSGDKSYAAIEEVKRQYVSAFPEASFEYFFIDEFFNSQYQNDERFGQLFMLFSWLGIFIVCLGILGLSRFLLMKRTKEIGLRKVNGASALEIVLLISLNMIKWNLIAFLLASPLAYVLMKLWLRNFPVRTSLDWWIFLLSGLLVLVTSLLTVSWQSWRAATMNPVKALRYE